VTGLDFSGPAITEARKLATQIGIGDEASFVQSDLYAAREVITDRFDVVYTGIGALCWLHDIREWARIVASFLKPGGFLYLYEGHPVLWALDNERADEALVITEPYFERQQPTEYTDEYSYVDGPALTHKRNFEWNHGIGEIVTALIDAGLRLEFLHEHREIAWQALPWMVPAGDQSPGAGAYQRRTSWQLPEAQRDRCPLMYSLKATKRG
jgi:SAM-dependent methyltransferase